MPSAAIPQEVEALRQELDELNRKILAAEAHLYRIRARNKARAMSPQQGLVSANRLMLSEAPGAPTELLPAHEPTVADDLEPAGVMPKEAWDIPAGTTLPKIAPVTEPDTQAAYVPAGQSASGVVRRGVYALGKELERGAATATPESMRGGFLDTMLGPDLAATTANLAKLPLSLANGVADQINEFGRAVKDGRLADAGYIASNTLAGLVPGQMVYKAMEAMLGDSKAREELRGQEFMPALDLLYSASVLRPHGGPAPTAEAARATGKPAPKVSERPVGGPETMVPPETKPSVPEPVRPQPEPIPGERIPPSKLDELMGEVVPEGEGAGAAVSAVEAQKATAPPKYPWEMTEEQLLAAEHRGPVDVGPGGIDAAQIHGNLLQNYRKVVYGGGDSRGFDFSSEAALIGRLQYWFDRSKQNPGDVFAQYVLRGGLVEGQRLGLDTNTLIRNMSGAKDVAAIDVGRTLAPPVVEKPSTTATPEGQLPPKAAIPEGQKAPAPQGVVIESAGSGYYRAIVDGRPLLDGPNQMKLFRSKVSAQAYADEALRTRSQAAPIYKTQKGEAAPPVVEKPGAERVPESELDQMMGEVVPEVEAQVLPKPPTPKERLVTGEARKLRAKQVLNIASDGGDHVIDLSTGKPLADGYGVSVYDSRPIEKLTDKRVSDFIKQNSDRLGTAQHELGVRTDADGNTILSVMRVVADQAKAERLAEQAGVDVVPPGGEPTMGNRPTEMQAGITPKNIVHSLRLLGETKVVDEIKKVMAPATRGEDASGTAEIMRHHLSEMRRSEGIAETALRDAQQYFSKRPVNENLDFINRVETGAKQPDANLQGITEILRDGLDSRRDAIRDLGTGKLKSFIENYFPHIYKDPVAARTTISDWVRRRPLEGGKTFLKERSMPTLADGIAAGLEPVSTNPVDMALAKMAEMDKYLMAHRVLEEMKTEGTLQFSRVGHRPPEGWVKINDRVSSVYYRNEAGELVQSGNYYAPEPAARIVNNYLSPGLRVSSSLFRYYRDTGNLINGAQLGASAYHLSFTSIDAITSKVALGLEQLSRGDAVGAAKSIAASPGAPVLNFLRGNKLYKEWFSPGTQGAEVGKYIDAMLKGGGRPTMDQFYRTAVTKKAAEMWRRGNYLGAAIRIPGMAIEQMARPILEYIVPRQKLGVFADLAKEMIRRNPDMPLEQQRAEAAKIWNSVDNRMGQLVYDNIFWNTALKDLLMATVRSVGWNLGTLREIGGGLKDFADQSLKLASGEKPELTHRMAYVTALPMVVGTMGVITQYLYTGETPKDLKDVFFPRTGEMDENGDPQRVSLPSYMKDAYHYGTDPWQTVKNKLHPEVGMIIDMLENEDYYGTEIRNVDDPFMKQVRQEAEYILEQFVPIGVRNIAREKEIEGGFSAKTAAPFFGIVPAPHGVNSTKAEDLARKFVSESRPAGSRTQKQADESKLKYTIRRDMVRQKNPAPESLVGAEKAGKLTDREVKNIKESVTQRPLERLMGSMTLERAVKVWDVASPAEREEIRGLITKKISSFMKNASMEDLRLMGPAIARVLKAYGETTAPE